MCKGGGNSTTTTQTSGPPPQVLQNYENVYGAAANLAGPAITNPSSVVAPFSTNQNWALNNSSYPAQMWGGYANAAQQDFQPGSAQAFLSPYIQDVVDATQKSFANQNAITNQGIVGNAIGSNAWGGDRAGVAQGIAAGQEQLAQAPVIANLYNQGYQQAQNASQSAGWGLAGLGAQAGNIYQGQLQNALTLGGLQQGQEQAYLNAPFQATNWLSNIAEGTGSLSGGQGTTTIPGPSPVSQGIGLGAAGIGLIGATGGFGDNGWLSNLFGDSGGTWSSGNRGGAIVHRASGGIAPEGFGGTAMPFGGAESPFGLGLPVPTQTPPVSSPSFIHNAPDITTTTHGTSSGSGILGDLTGAAGIAAKVIPFLRIGGVVPGYDDGGDVSDSPMTGIAPYRPDPWMALATAGFGAAAGRSPFALQNIGEGGLKGMQFYEQQREIAPRIAAQQAELGLIPSKIELTKAEAEKASTEAAFLKAQANWSMGSGLSALTGNIADVKNELATPLASGTTAPTGGASDVMGFKALLPIENPKGDPNAVSPKGAIGPAQVLPSTASQVLGREVKPDELKGPLSLQVGQQYYSQMLQRYGGDHDAAAVAYNAGPGVADKYVASGKNPAVLPAETQNYVKQAAANRAQLSGGSSDQAAGSGVLQMYNQGLTILQRQLAIAAQAPMLPQQKMALIDSIQGKITALLQSHPDVKGAQAAAEATARIVPETQLHANQKSIDIAAAGPETAARIGAEPGTYVLPGGGEGTAPKSQIMAGTAPGMGGQTPSHPVTAGGKFDPDPQSLVGPRPGLPMTKLGKSDEDKLALDTKTYGEYRTAAENAPQTIQRTQELGQILQRLNTGKVLEAGQELSAWARAAGFEGLIRKGYDPSDAEMVNKLATSLVFEQLKAVGGRPMVSEIQGLTKANAEIAKTPQANLDIVGNIEGSARYAQDRFIQASKVYNQYHQLGNFDEKYLSNSPLGQIFDDTKRKLGAGQTPASQIMEHFPDAKRAPDGNWYVERGGKYSRIQTPQ